MISSKSIVNFLFFLLVAISNVEGQNSKLAEEYIQSADDYKKNLKPDSAIIFYEKASIEFRKLGYIDKFVYSNNQLGILLTRQDKYEKAKTFLNEALSIGLSALDSNNLAIATTYLSLGVIYRAEENYKQSLLYHNKALSIRLFKLGEFHADVATSYGNIGNVYLSMKDFDTSIEVHLKAMKIREKLFGVESAEIIDSYFGLGNAYREKKIYNTSLEYFEKALNNKIIQRGEGHKDLSKYYKNVSDVYYLMENKEQGDFNKAKSENVLKN